MRRRAVWSLMLAGLAGMAAVEDEPLFRSETRLVVLHASVSDQDGRLVTNLSAGDFTVLEDGVPQPLKIFRREDVPVSIGLIIDNSASMRIKRREVEEATLALVKASNPEDEVFVVNFNESAYLDVAFTSDLGELERGLARLDARGSTAMRDALGMSLDYLRRGRQEKKVLLVVTDGDDNTSAVTIAQLARKAQQQETIIYGIGLLNEAEPKEAERSRRELEELTRATGGAAFYPAVRGEIGRVARQIAHDLRNQYVLAYTPTNQRLDGTFRRITVQVRGPNHPVARTRAGYWATPAQRVRVAEARVLP